MDAPPGPEQGHGEVGVLHQGVVGVATHVDEGPPPEGTGRAGDDGHHAEHILGPAVDVEADDVLQRLEPGQPRPPVADLDIAGHRPDFLSIMILHITKMHHKFRGGIRK